MALQKRVFGFVRLMMPRQGYASDACSPRVAESMSCKPSWPARNVSSSKDGFSCHSVQTEQLLDNHPESEARKNSQFGEVSSCDARGVMHTKSVMHRSTVILPPPPRYVQQLPSSRLTPSQQLFQPAHA